MGSDFLVVTPVDDTMRRWKLLKPVTVCLEDDGCFTIPEGFVTDFASVPRCFWSIIPPMGRYGKAAILHDYLYHTKSVSRKEADKIFLKAMDLLGVSAWKKYVMYFAVRLFGWVKW